MALYPVGLFRMMWGLSVPVVRRRAIVRRDVAYVFSNSQIDQSALKTPVHLEVGFILLLGYFVA
jgi:hypothetical protein